MQMVIYYFSHNQSLLEEWSVVQIPTPIACLKVRVRARVFLPHLVSPTPVDSSFFERSFFFFFLKRSTTTQCKRQDITARFDPFVAV